MFSPTVNKNHYITYKSLYFFNGGVFRRDQANDVTLLEQGQLEGAEYVHQDVLVKVQGGGVRGVLLHLREGF